MSRPLVLRSTGYVTLCGGLVVLLLAVSVGAFPDPTLADTRDPDWMFFAVGRRLVRAAPACPVRWLGRSGGPDHSAHVAQVDSKRFMMMELYGHDRVVIEIHELAGGGWSHRASTGTAERRNGLDGQGRISACAVARSVGGSPTILQRCASHRDPGARSSGRTDRGMSGRSFSAPGSVYGLDGFHRLRSATLAARDGCASSHRP